MKKRKLTERIFAITVLALPLFSFSLNTYSMEDPAIHQETGPTRYNIKDILQSLAKYYNYERKNPIAWEDIDSDFYEIRDTSDVLKHFKYVKDKGKRINITVNPDDHEEDQRQSIIDSIFISLTGTSNGVRIGNLYLHWGQEKKKVKYLEKHFSRRRIVPVIHIYSLEDMSFDLGKETRKKKYVLNIKGTRHYLGRKKTPEVRDVRANVYRTSIRGNSMISSLCNLIEKYLELILQTENAEDEKFNLDALNQAIIEGKIKEFVNSIPNDELAESSSYSE